MAKKTLADLRTMLKKVAVEVQKELDVIAVQMANDAKALSYRNMTGKGVAGAAYSTHEYPAFFLLGKALNATGRAFIKQKMKKKELTNWKGLRGAQGLPTNKVDLQYSGKMWAGVAVVRIDRSGGITRALLGGNTKDAQDKMDWNRERYGDFIEDNLTKDDKKLITKISTNKVKDILKKNGILNK